MNVHPQSAKNMREIWKILIIDDDEDDLLLIKGMLKEARGNKFEVYWASTYQAGVEALYSNTYNAVLVDYDLGAKTGVQLIREAAQNGYAVPLILFTGRGTYAVDLEAMEAGATLYLSKGEANSLLLERSIRYAIELKQREHALRASEERFERAFNASPNAQVISYIHDGRIETINDGFVTLFGYQREEVIGRTSLELKLFANPADRDRAIQQLSMRPSLRGFELEVRTKTGELRIANLSVEILSVGSQNLLLTVIEDITVRRRAEEALREMAHMVALDRSRLSTILNHLPVGVWIADEDGRLIDANRYADQIWAGEAPLVESVDQYQEYLAWDARTGNKLLAHEYPLAQALRTQEVIEPVELRIRRLDGTEGYVLVSAAPMKDENGRLVGAVGINVDVTRLRQAEDLLKYHASLLDNLHDSVIATDTEGRITAWNNAAEALYGYAAADVLGKTASEVLRTEFNHVQRDFVLKQLNETGRSTLEVVQYAQDGRQIFVEATIIARRDSQGNDIGFVAANRDITGRKRREANQAILAGIAQDFDQFTTAGEIMQAVGGKLGAFLDIFYCHFMYIDEARDQGVYLDRWNADSVPTLPDAVSLTAHVTDAFRQLVHAGQTVVCKDTQADPIMKGEENIKVGAGSFITVPFHHKGEWKYLFSVHDLQPRQWREDEIELVREVAHRLFPRLESARVEEALRESEARSHNLYEAKD